jgi:hypothetical protein
MFSRMAMSNIFMKEASVRDAAKLTWESWQLSMLRPALSPRLTAS